MAKNEANTRLDNGRKEGDKRSPDNKVKTDAENERKPARTKVKNAHATGLGAIGRNDQRLDKEETDFSNY